MIRPTKLSVTVLFGKIMVYILFPVLDYQLGKVGNSLGGLEFWSFRFIVCQLVYAILNGTLLRNM